MAYNRKYHNSIKEVSYDSDRYYIYNEDQNLAYYDDSQETFDYSDMLTKVDNRYGVVSGTMNLFNGSFDVHAVLRFEDFLSRLRDTTRLVVEYDKDSDAIFVENYHHDGVNTYYFKPFDIMKKHEVLKVAKKLDLDIDSSFRVNDIVDYIISHVEGW